MTTYEQELIGRITFEEVGKWLLKDRSIHFSNAIIRPKNKPSYNRIKIIGCRTLKNNSVLPLLFFKDLARKANKSIIELCYEIKPITVERLNKITIEQWGRWLMRQNHDGGAWRVKNINGKNVVQWEWFDSNIKADVVEFALPESKIKDLDVAWNTFLLKIVRYFILNAEDLFDYVKQAKAIHDLVWELEQL